MTLSDEEKYPRSEIAMRRLVISFDGEITSRELEKRLILLFAPYYLKGALSRDVIEDLLIIKDLRMIVQCLKICSGSDRNVHKDIFSSVLLKYLYSDTIIEKFSNFDMEKYKNTNFVIQHCSTQYPKIDKSLISPFDIIEIKRPQSTPTEKTEEKLKNNSDFDKSISEDENNTPYMIIDRNSLDYEAVLRQFYSLPNGFQYLNIFYHCNRILEMINERICALELQVNELLERISRAENVYFTKK